MGKKIIAVWTMALVMLLSVILGGCGATKPGSYTLSAAWCQEVTDKIKAMQPIDIPGNLAQETSLKNGDEFDVNDYFPVLKHLSLQAGYVLDYAYFVTEAGGSPILYARHKNEEPYPNYFEIGKAGNTITRAENDISLIWLTKEDDGTAKYGNQIKIDKSTQGYFEYTVLQLLGGQFYLFFKANLYDVRIVSIDSRVEDILKEIDNSTMTPIDESFKATARSIDLQPTVIIGEETVDVSLVIFTKWGGFTRATFTMNHNYPHSVTKYETQSLLAYDCGITL